MEYIFTKSRWAKNHCWFLFSWILSVLVFQGPLRALTSLSLHDSRYSHLLVIPLISVSLAYLQRKSIFSEPRYNFSWGVPLLLVGIALAALAPRWGSPSDPTQQLPAMALAVVLVWMAEFLLCYGLHSLRAAVFPLVFLVLMIPIPTALLDAMILGLQAGSALISYLLFKVIGVPVFWQGFKFTLPGVQIEIAAECSGIRSSMAFFITSILAGHVFLQSNWRKACLIFCAIPVAIFKNAVRIVTISWLGVYVDRGYLYGNLHRYSGLPFSLISLAILVPLLLALQKGEAKALPQQASETVQLS